MNNIIKLLLVEDDETLSFIVKDNLEQKNHSVDLAKDGRIAMELFEKTITTSSS